jgi:hypothetical protein
MFRSYLTQLKLKQENRVRGFEKLLFETETQLFDVKKIYDSVREQDPLKPIAYKYDFTKV